MDTEDRPRFRLRIVPILIVAALGFGLPILAAYGAAFASHRFAMPSPNGPILPWLYSQHAFQLAVALFALAVVKYFVPADYGLHWPREKTISDRRYSGVCSLAC